MWTTGVPAWFSRAPREKPPLSLERRWLGIRTFGLCFANVRHERIHTKRGSCVMMQPQEEDADDLAALEVLDEVRGGWGGGARQA